MLRLADGSGDPVIGLQTNFGGGKTHSLLALYHLVTYSTPGVLGRHRRFDAGRGADRVAEGAQGHPGRHGIVAGPAEPNGRTGIETHTLWGELAYQLGGAEGYALVANRTRREPAPDCRVLIRSAEALFAVPGAGRRVGRLCPPALQRLRAPRRHPSDANLTFAQALSEAAAAVPRALVVGSLPASQIEIGGQGGRDALDSLKNTFGRVEASSQSATADEGFEIVRRRLFEPIADRDATANRDAVIRAFGDMYRQRRRGIPAGQRRRPNTRAACNPPIRSIPSCSSGSTMTGAASTNSSGPAACCGSWRRRSMCCGNGTTPAYLILPSSIPLDSPVIESELVRYLDHNWSAVLAKDVDGTTSVPLAIDQEVPALGRYSATRRVARTVWMGSAPTYEAGKNPGIDDRRIKLGCAQPGESAGNFGDALRRLADRATYLYQDGTRYWFSTQPSVARLADDRAAQLDPADIEAEIVKRLKRNEQPRMRSDFAGVHAAPAKLGRGRRRAGSAAGDPRPGLSALS